MVQEVLEPIDPLTRVDDASGALFIQAGRLDSIVPRRALPGRDRRRPGGHEGRVVPGGHHALDGRARSDRLEWLSQQLANGGD